METWGPLAAKLAALGLPVLGKMIGGNIPVVGPFITMFGGGEALGTLAAKAIALALGVEPTPDAINNAIDNGDTTEVVTKLQGVQAEAVARWPALADISKSQDTADVALAQLNEDSYLNRIRGDVATNGFWLSLYRPILNYAAAANLIAFGVLITYAVYTGGETLHDVAAASDLIIYWATVLTAALGIHYYTRSTERKAALTTATNSTSTTTVQTK